MADGRNSSRQGDRTSPKYQAKKAASERVAAARAAQVRAARKRSIMYAGGIGGIVVIIIAVIVIVGVSHKSSKTAAKINPVVPASATVTAGLAKAVSLDTTAPVLSTITGPPKRLGAAALTAADGKPEVLYIGAEYCPYCAVTRWPLTLALSRFGTFTGLQTTLSSSTDVGANTPTLSFKGSTYTSDYINFTGIEYQDGAGKVIGKLTAEQSSLFQSLGGGSYPFIDFGGKWVQSGASYSTDVLKGLTPEQVATTLSDATTKVGSTIQSSADIFTAAICQMDGGKPANVCTAAGVADSTASLNAIK